MIPLAIVLLLLVGSLVGLLLKQQQDALNKASQLVLVESADRLAQLLAEQAHSLAALEEILVRDRDLRDALAAQDRPRLLATLGEVYATLQMNYAVTHFYLHDANRTNLVQLHEPSNHGDLINSYTAREAERRGETTSGIELGPLGTFTLRVVRPVFQGGQLIGYLELGKEIEDVLTTIHADEEIELAVMVHKELLQKTAWTSRMELLSRDSDWTRYADQVLVYSSLNPFPRSCDAIAGNHAHPHGIAGAEASFDGKTWQILTHSLEDSSGAEVGKLVILHNNTGFKAAQQRLWLIAIPGTFILLAGFFTFLFVLLRQTNLWVISHQDELAAANRRMQDLLAASSQVAIIATDPDGLITTFNTGAEKMLGYSAAEIVGKQTPQIIHTESEMLEHAKILSEEFGYPVTGFELFALRPKRDGFEERRWTYVRKDGSELTVNLAVHAIWDPSGAFTGLLGMAIDITERQRAEAENRRVNKDLKQQMAYAKAMAAKAEAANKAKSEFLANMSHEIRTPMNGITGMTGLLLDTELTQTQRHYAETAKGSAETLLGLINEILDFSKIEAGKLELETLDIDLGGLLDTLARTMAIEAQAKNLELVCDVDPGTPEALRGDPGRLRQILTNLMGNAIKFTQEGEIVLRVCTVAKSEEDVMLRFSVRDSGIGIPEGKSSELFSQFTQVDASTTRKYGGTGLGLAISKQLAEAMGGEIGVNSVLGEGSEFWFTARFGRQRGQSDSLVPFAELKGTRILIVDDNAANRDFLARQCTAWGLHSETAGDGESALAMLREATHAGTPYRLALLDLQMPGLDGEALARTIREDDALARSSLLLMAPVSTAEKGQKLVGELFHAYLTKPVCRRQLHEDLGYALHGRTRPARPAPVSPATDPDSRKWSEESRILVVDDNRVNRQVAVGILKRLGVSADSVSSGAEALDALRRLPYDLVLMDCQMPEMDGYEATAKIRATDSGLGIRDIPIIALTANAMPGDRETCLRAGMNDYASKPVNPQALAALLEKWAPRFDDVEKPTHQFLAQTLSSTTVFDRSALLSRLLDDDELLRSVIELFLEEVPKHLAVLRASIESDDGRGVAREAQALESACECVGAGDLRDVAARMEQAGNQSLLENVTTLIHEFEGRFHRLVESLLSAAH